MNVPLVSFDEMKDRIARLRQVMAAHDLDLAFLSSPQTIAYLTNFGSTGYYLPHFLVLAQEGPETFVIRDFEVPTLEQATATPGVMAWGQERTFYHALKEVLAKHCGKDEPRIGVEGASNFTPYRNILALSAISGGQLVDISPDVEALRRVKSPSELSKIETAGRATVGAVEASIKTLSIGVSEKQLSLEILTGMIDRGSDFPVSIPYVYFGDRTRLAMQQPTDASLGAKDPIYIECGARCGYYTAALTRTGAAQPDQEYTEIYGHMRSAFDLMLGSLRAGAISADVDAQARLYLRKHGLEKWWFHRGGYSLGIGFTPGWGEGMVLDISPDNRMAIPEGAVLHLVSLIRHHGYGFIGMSETVIVELERARSVTPFSRECIML